MLFLVLYISRPLKDPGVILLKGGGGAIRNQKPAQKITENRNKSSHKQIFRIGNQMVSYTCQMCRRPSKIRKRIFKNETLYNMINTSESLFLLFNFCLNLLYFPKFFQRMCRSAISNGARAKNGYRGWSPPPLSFFCLSHYFSRGQSAENHASQSLFAPQPHGNTCYGG